MKYFISSLCMAFLLSITASAHSQTYLVKSKNSTKMAFPFRDGFYCDYAIDKKEPIFRLEYPELGYPLAEYGCEITRYTKFDKGYVVEQECDVTENNQDRKREEHWEADSGHYTIYIDGVKLRRCKK